LAGPYGDTRRSRIQRERKTRSRNTADHAKATPKCIRTPTIAVEVPPSNASLPRRVLATP
jgi:hypothetical protein